MEIMREAGGGVLPRAVEAAAGEEEEDLRPRRAEVHLPADRHLRPLHLLRWGEKSGGRERAWEGRELKPRAWGPLAAVDHHIIIPQQRG